MSETRALVSYKIVGNEVTGLNAHIVAANQQDGNEFVKDHMQEPWPTFRIRTAWRKERDAVRGYLVARRDA